MLILFLAQAPGYPQQIQKDFVDTTQRVIISDTVLLKDLLNTLSVTKAYSNISIKCDLLIDLNKKFSSGKYELKNLSKQDVMLDYTSPVMGDQPKTIMIRPNKSRTTAFKQKITVSQLDAKTNIVIVRPYLLVLQSKNNDQLLIADHYVTIQVILPSNAKILKSTIPLKRTVGNKLEWEFSGLKTIPPIYLWYSTNEMKVELMKETQVNDSEVFIKLTIKNTGLSNVEDLFITTQFPADNYEPDWKASDGEFILQQGVMYTWRMNINYLNSNESRKVIFKLLKNPLLPYYESEIYLYNKKGELLDIK